MHKISLEKADHFSSTSCQWHSRSSKVDDVCFIWKKHMPISISD